MALATFGCQWNSGLGPSTAFSIARCLLKLKLYTALVFWSPQSIITYSSEKKYRCRASPNKPLPLPYIDDPATVDLSVIVPTYNETKRMPKMLEATIKHVLSTPKRKTEILIIDDGSTDGTTELALKYAKENPKIEIRVVTREKNSGKGGAVRHGMLHSRGERLLMVDADDASRFEDLELLWAALDRLGEKSPDNAAIAIGSRAHLVKTEAVVKVKPLEFSAKSDR
jgi:dolichyl-phosphate beta-glucosyltransferase